MNYAILKRILSNRVCGYADPKRSGESGFTLIELMVVVAIVAILGALVYPNYSAYVLKSRVTEAKSTLASERVRLEQYLQDNRRYTTAPGSGVCGTNASLPTSPVVQFFTYTAVCTDTTYTITATGNAAQAMNGYVFTVNDSNLRRTTSFVGASGLPKNCWIDVKSGSC